MALQATTPKTVEAWFSEMEGAWGEMQTAIADANAELKKHGTASEETKALIEKLNQRLDESEVAMKRMLRESAFAGARDAAKAAKERSPEYKAFSELMRYGFQHLEAEQKVLVTRASKSDVEGKALSLGDSTIAGYLAPPEFVADIIKPLLQFSPIRQYANVRSTSNRSVRMPIRKGTFAATWVAETGTRSETTGLKYGLEELATEELYAEVLISEQDLEDAAFDMDAQIQMESAEQFAIAEGLAFVSGTGVGRPYGFLSDANLPTSNNGNTTTLQYNGVVTAAHAIKTPYAVNASWVMNRQTMGAVRKIVDSQGRPLWDPSLAPGNPATILGYPVVEAVDMPAVASGNLPIVFGDFKRAYTIVDRIQMVVQRLVEKYAEQGQVAYLVRKRVGGQLVLAEALVALKMA